MVSKEALVSMVLGLLILTLVLFLSKSKIRKVPELGYFGGFKFKGLSNCPAGLDGSGKGDIVAYASECCSPLKVGVCGGCPAELQADGVYTGFGGSKCNVYLNAEEPSISSILIERDGETHSYIWESFGEYKRTWFGCCLEAVKVWDPCKVVASALECCSSKCFSDNTDGLRQAYGILIPKGEHKQTLKEFLIAWCGNPDVKCLLCYKCTKEDCDKGDTRWYVCGREVPEKVYTDLDCDGENEEVGSGVVSVDVWKKVDNKWICTPGGWEEISEDVNS